MARSAARRGVPAPKASTTTPGWTAKARIASFGEAAIQLDGEEHVRLLGLRVGGLGP